MRLRFYLPFLLVLAGAIHTNAQVLDFMNKVTVPLKDGTNVVLFGAARSLDTLFSGEYYYLPTNLRLSKKRDGVPEFLFLKYTTNESAGGVQGALMHFLMQWGLTPEQEKEVQDKLSARVKGLAAGNPRYRLARDPRLMGAANVKTDEENSFQIISALLSDRKSTPTLVTSGRAPVMPGGKVAVGALLEKNAAQLMAATFEKGRSITDVSVSLRFRYDVLMPAVSGKITVNWQRIDSVYQHYTRTATNRDGGDKGEEDNYVKDTEVDSLFSLMRETKAVDVQLENLQPESQAAQDMMNAFMEYFLRSVSEKEFRKPDPDETQRPGANPREYSYGYRSYKVDHKKIQQKMAQRSETYTLNVRLPITQEFTLTENLADDYDQMRDNKSCINTVLLDDPFFEHRDIHLILDLDAEEMFGKELNFVTVDIRKRRSEKDAHEFSSQVTFDKKYFSQPDGNGNRAVVTYSKAQDDSPDVFEYKVQWSLRGGRVFPADTSWTKGRWQGITLTPPVAPTPIRFETDLEDLKNLDIKNVSLQLRYYKFGKEVESSFNISAAAGVGYLEKNIYMDRNTQGYAYRTVFYHKTKGPLATEWDAQLNTGYMYAVIPDELRDQNQETIEKMVALGKEIIPIADGKEVNKGSVLDKFKELLKTN